MTVNCKCYNMEMIIDEPNGVGYVSDENGNIHCESCNKKCATCENYKCME